MLYGKFIIFAPSLDVAKNNSVLEYEKQTIMATPIRLFEKYHVDRVEKENERNGKYYITKCLKLNM